MLLNSSAIIDLDSPDDATFGLGLTLLSSVSSTSMSPPLLPESILYEPNNAYLVKL